MRANRNIYNRKSKDFVNRILFLKIKRTMENDLGKIKNIVSYNNRTYEISFTVKENAGEQVITYQCEKDRERTVLNRVVNSTKQAVSPELDIADFKILLIDKNGNTTVNHNKAMIIKCLLSYRVGSKSVNEFLVFNCCP